MEEPELLDPMIRIAIFSRARTLADKVSNRLKEAKSFLEHDDEHRVLLSLDGIESDLKAINCLMYMCVELSDSDKENDK